MAGTKSILFEAVSNIVFQKSEALYKQHTQDEEQWKTFSKFMILRYMTMSCNEKIRDIVIENYLTLERMPDKMLYKWLLINVPRQNNGFIRYIK